MKRSRVKPYLETGTSLVLGTAIGFALGHMVAGAFVGVAVGLSYEVLSAKTYTKHEG